MSSKYVTPHGRDMDVSPISQVGRVTCNARVDMKAIKLARRANKDSLLYQDSRTRDEGVWDFKKYELVLVRDERSDELNKGAFVGRVPLVISNLNSILTKDAATEEEVIEKYSLLGQVQASVNVHGDMPEGPEVSVSVGGLNSLLNTSTEPLYAGDLLYWDVIKRQQNQADKTDYTRVSQYSPEGRNPIVVRRFTWKKAAEHGHGKLKSFSANQNQPKTMANGGALFDVLAKVIASVSAKQGANAAAKLAAYLNDNESKEQILQLLEASCTVHKSITKRIFARCVTNAGVGSLVDIVPPNYLL